MYVYTYILQPIVTGVCVLCIGVALTGTGIKYWGGGAFCADNRYYKHTHTHTHTHTH